MSKSVEETKPCADCNKPVAEDELNIIYNHNYAVVMKRICDKCFMILVDINNNKHKIKS